MIKVEKGKVIASGNKSDLMCDLTLIVKHLTEEHCLTKDHIGLAVETAYEPIEEIRKKAISSILECLLFGAFGHTESEEGDEKDGK